MKKREIKQELKDQDFKPIYLLDIFESLLIAQNPQYQLAIHEMLQEFRKIDESKSSKTYPLQQFYPFLWAAICAQFHCPANKSSTTPLQIRFTNDDKELHPDCLGHYVHAINTVRVRTGWVINNERPASGFTFMNTIMDTLIHELTHALTNLFYDQACVPPLHIWSKFLATRSLMSALVSEPSSTGKPFFKGLSSSRPEKFPNESTASPFFKGLRGYDPEKFPNELIARTVAYTLLNGEIPFTYTDTRLDKALQAFLVDSESFLKRVIKDMPLAKIFPWLVDAIDPKKGFFLCPAEDYELFIMVSDAKDLWDLALKTNDINHFKRIMAFDPNFTSFPADKLLSLAESPFKTQIKNLLVQSMGGRLLAATMVASAHTYITQQVEPLLSRLILQSAQNMVCMNALFTMAIVQQAIARRVIVPGSAPASTRSASARFNFIQESEQNPDKDQDKDTDKSPDKCLR